MKTVILLTSLLLGGCQTYIYDSLPSPTPAKDQTTIDLSIGVNEAKNKLEGFSLADQIRQSNTFTNVLDSNDKNSKFDLLLVTRLESGPTGSPGGEFMSAMLSALSLFLIPSGRGFGYTLSYYLLDSKGNIVVHYTHEKNATMMMGILLLPIDGLAEEKPVRFQADIAREATEHFLSYLKEDRRWVEKVRHFQQQSAEYDEIFAELGIE